MIYDKAQYEFEKGISDALEGAPLLLPQSEWYRMGWHEGQPTTGHCRWWGQSVADVDSVERPADYYSHE